MDDLSIHPIAAKDAIKLVVDNHYLHRRPPISFAFGVFKSNDLLGCVTYGIPASRHLQKSACPTAPDIVIELNRLWLDDSLPKNCESWFVSKTLKLLPPRIVVSYADPVIDGNGRQHFGFIYRALNFYYAGWTDMHRKTPRIDYLPADPTTHTRDAFRNGYVEKRYRVAKVKYWTVTGNKRERRDLERLCPWPKLSWIDLPPPTPGGTHTYVTKDFQSIKANAA